MSTLSPMQPEGGGGDTSASPLRPLRTVHCTPVLRKSADDAYCRVAVSTLSRLGATIGDAVLVTSPSPLSRSEATGQDDEAKNMPLPALSSDSYHYLCVAWSFAEEYTDAGAGAGAGPHGTLGGQAEVDTLVRIPSKHAIFSGEPSANILCKALGISRILCSAPASSSTRASNTSNNLLVTIQRLSVKAVHAIRVTFTPLKFGVQDNVPAITSNVLSIKLLKRFLRRKYLFEGCIVRLADGDYSVTETYPRGLVCVTGDTLVTFQTSRRFKNEALSPISWKSSPSPAAVVMPLSPPGPLDATHDATAPDLLQPRVIERSDPRSLLEEMIEMPLLFPHAFAHIGVECPKGILLHGPPGVGKTYAVKKAIERVSARMQQQLQQRLPSSPANTTWNNDIEGRESQNFAPLDTAFSAPGASPRANHQGVHLEVIEAGSLLSSIPGESEENLARIFGKARAMAAQQPCVLFIDEIDVLCPKRADEFDGGGSATSTRLVAQMLMLMDGLHARGRLVVVGATNRANVLDPALRRPGRFDREVEVKPPNKAKRKEILSFYFHHMQNVHDDVVRSVNELAGFCVGYVGADLQALCREASLAAMHEHVRANNLIVARQMYESVEDRLSSDHASSTNSSNSLSPSVQVSSSPSPSLLPPKSQDFADKGSGAGTSSSLVSSSSRPTVRKKHFLMAMHKVGASSLRENIIQGLGDDDDRDSTSNNSNNNNGDMHPATFHGTARRAAEQAGEEKTQSTDTDIDTCWDSIGGLDDVKKRLRQAVQWPLMYPQTFKRLGLTPPRGILLHGPPGGGKTTVARALARLSDAAFLMMDSAAVFSCLLGEAERYVRQLFVKARTSVPCIVFIDEIDAIVTKRAFGESGRNGGGGGADDSMAARILSTLLNEMDGVAVADGVLVVAATNRKDMLDPALLRPGRFDNLILVPSPDQAGALAILRVHTRRMPLAEDVDLVELSGMIMDRKQTRREEVSGAFIANVCKEAAMAVIREQKNSLFQTEEQLTTQKVWMRHFALALRT